MRSRNECQARVGVIFGTWNAGLEDSDQARAKVLRYSSAATCGKCGRTKTGRSLSQGEGVMAQIEAANLNTCGVGTSAFDSEDLSFLQVVVDELLAGIIAEDSNVQGKSKEVLKRDLAKAVFASARPGERDAASLKRQVKQSYSDDDRRGAAYSG